MKNSEKKDVKSASKKLNSQIEKQLKKALKQLKKENEKNLKKALKEAEKKFKKDADRLLTITLKSFIKKQGKADVAIESEENSGNSEPHLSTEELQVEEPLQTGKQNKNSRKSTAKIVDATDGAVKKTSSRKPQAKSATKKTGTKASDKPKPGTQEVEVNI